MKSSDQTPGRGFLGSSRINRVPVLPFRSRNEPGEARSYRTGKRSRHPPPPHPEDILEDGTFRRRLNRIARERNSPPGEAARTAERHLREIAARPSRVMVEVAAFLGRILYRRAYGAVHYDRDEVAALQRLSVRHPIAFLPGHRSNLDRPVMHHLLWKNGLGPNYTAGGINMNFFPIGPIWRRAGVFFIRRSFTNNPIYKLVLQSYITYLVEQHLPIEWYIEGGRSRTGKLRPPRYGLLGYVADTVTTGKSNDMYLIPASISYDHVLEVAAYSDEEAGVMKEKETLRWLVRNITSLRKRYGDIHVRFGEPLSLRGYIDLDRSGADRRHDLQLLASSVCRRINEITPVTPSSLVVVALLAGPERGLSFSDLERAVSELVHDIESRDLPSTGSLSRMLTGPGLESVVTQLANLDIAAIETRDQPRSLSVYRIRTGRRLAASYYRNAVVHFFLTPAVAELALVAASRTGTSDRPFDAFRGCVSKVRNLLAFEFFLSEEEGLIREMENELGRRLGEGWMDRVDEGRASNLLDELRPHRAPWALRSFVEAYRVVAEQLIDLPVGQPWNRDRFLKSCLDRGAEQVSRQLIPGESSSISLFSNAVRVAARRDLLEPASNDTIERRTAFACELRTMLTLFDPLDTGITAVDAGRRRSSR